jgi:hypothetical protein
LVELNSSLFVPKKSRSVLAIALPKALSPEGCSGYGGLLISGSQVGSASVAGLPSLSASRIAVIGRQKSHRALSSQAAIPASAAVRYSIAKSRALSAIPSP